MIRFRFKEKINVCWKWRFSLLLVVVFCSNLIHGQFLKSQPIGDPQPQYRNFSVEQGLPSSETYFVHQDKKGYIWICTDRGVARYDGYRFRVFTDQDGLPDNVVFKIYEDYSGKIWFLSFNGLLSYHDGKKIVRYKYNNRIKQYLKGYQPSFKSLIVDRNNTIYYAIHDLGCLRIDDKGKMSDFHNDAEMTIVLKKIAGQELLSVRGKHPTDKSFLFSLRNLTEGNKKSSMVFQIWRRACFARFGNYGYLQTDDKVSELKSGVSRNLINCCYTGSDEKYVWIGAIKSGVYAITHANFQKGKSEELHLLKKLSVTSVLKDQQGGYWFTTLERGIFYSPGLYIRNYTTEQGLLNNEVRCINGYEDRIALGFSYGYQILNKNELFNIRNTTYLTTAVGFSGSGKIHLSGLIIKRTDNNGIPVVFEKDIRHYKAYCRHKDGIFGIGSRIVLYHDNNGINDTLYNFFQLTDRQSPNWISALTQTPYGTYYVGSISGLYKLKDKKMNRKGLTDPLFHVRVTDLAYNDLWGVVVATRGKGVYCFRNDKVTEQWSVTDGLSDNQINEITVDDDGSIWVATNKGVSYIRKTTSGTEIQQLTTMHGLISNEITGIYCGPEAIWIATKAGLSRVNRELLKHNSPGGNLWLEFFRAGKYHFSKQSHSTIPATARGFQFHFRSTDYRVGKRRYFRYRFQENEDWINTEKPDIIQSNFPSGAYTLEVCARNENGQWSNPKVLCRFTVLPPFYATWYFITGMILLGIFGMFLLFRLRLRQLKRRHSLQDTINQLEQKALRAQMNPHFIFNSLNSIQSFLIYEENEKAEKYLLKFAQLIRITLNNSRETYIPLKAEMDSLKRYLELEQMRFKDKFTFEIHNELTPDELQYGVPPMLIQPFVENAVLHGFKTIDSGGLISLQFLAIKDNGLECIVEDNGVGRKATLQHKLADHKSFGTKITEERLNAFRQKYGDDFRIEIIDKEENGVASGTKVVLRIPVVGTHEMIGLTD